MKTVTSLVLIAVLGLSFSGCSYRSDGISVPEQIDASSNVLISETSLDDKGCITIEHIDASVKKLTLFHKDPTKEQVDYILSEKAKALNANAVRNVKYSSGVGVTTWGYMDAEGDASKCHLSK